MTSESTQQPTRAPAAGAGTASVAAPPASHARPDRGSLLVLLAGTFIAVLDFFIVNVSIPSIQRELHATSAGIEFIVTGFAVAYASGLIIGGRLGDIYGRRAMFAAGMIMFVLSSVLCGVAPVIGVLVVGRVLQGLAAALMSPQVLSILGTMYSGEARARAFNAYGVTMGLAAVFGQLIGGLLIHANIFGWSWRTCFLINVPIGIVALALVPRYVPESRSPGRPRVDLGGMAIVALALIAVTLPLIEGRELGWPAWAWVSLGASIVLFALLIGYESVLTKRGSSPMIDLGAFRERAFSAGLAAQLVFWTGQASFFLVFALYVQFGRGLSPLNAGLIFIAIGAGYMATSTTARYVAVKLGRQVIALGGVLRVIGLCLMIIVVTHIGVGGNIWWLVVPLIIDGAGMGFAVAPLASTVLSRITPQHAGSASGMLTTGIQVGNALGVAIVGVIFYGVLTHSTGVNGYAHAFSWSIVYLIGVGLTLAILVQLLPRRPGGATK